MTTHAARVASFLAPTRDADATDADLLHRFTSGADDAAFTALVARHGPMVFGVCRRVLRDWHLAEDAFQATFLVLARRATAISPPGAVAGWLHGVAYKVAKNTQRATAKRFQRERPTDDFPDPGTESEPAINELPAVLDEELRRLPGKYRDLLVACDLEGRPRQPVATALGIPEGTLSSRLTAARKMLAERLTRRGIAPAVVAGVAIGSPVAVASEVSRLALAAAARLGSNAPGTVSEAVSALASDTIRAMTMRKVLPYSLLLVAATAALGLAAATYPTDPPPEPVKPVAVPVAQVPARADQKPLPKGPNKLLVIRSSQIVMIDPDGKNEKVLTEKADKPEDRHPRGAFLSPDGTRYAAQVAGPIPPFDGTPGAKRAPTTVFVRALNEKEPGTDLEVQCQTFAWSADGTELLCCEFEDGAGKVPETKHFTINVKTKERTPIKIPSDHIVTDWTRDGKYIVTTRVRQDEANPMARLYLMNRDGTEHKALTGEKEFALFGRISPDGKTVLCSRVELPNETPAEKKARQDAGGAPPQGKRIFSFLDVATGKMTPVPDVPLNAELQAYCWSPDGKKIAYSWRELHEGKPEDLIMKETESHIIICDADGKNQKTILTEKGMGQWHVTLLSLDWR